MILNFRQGLLKSDNVSDNQSFLNRRGSEIDLIVTDSSKISYTIAHHRSNYLIDETESIDAAWSNISADTVWLYIDINRTTGVRTFGHTKVEPIFQAAAPKELVEDLHWYDVQNFKHFVCRNSRWIEVIRVFIAQVTGRSFISMSVNADESFGGTQIGQYGDRIRNNAGRIIYNDIGRPIILTTGEFLTTASDMFVENNNMSSVVIESTILTLTAAEAIGAFRVIALNDDETIRPARYRDVNNSVVGIIDQHVVRDEVTNVLVSGSVINENWDWSDHIGGTLYVNDSGALVTEDPHVTDRMSYPTPRSPVGRVISAKRIWFSPPMTSYVELVKLDGVTDLSRDWATKMDGLVEGIDYSSKWYAYESAKSSDESHTAQLASELAQSNAELAQIAAEEAEQGAIDAANNSSDSADAAKASELAAKDSEDAAKDSEDAAKASEDNIQHLVDRLEDAEEFVDQTRDLMDDITVKNEEARQHAINSQLSADASSQSASESKASEDAAKASEDAAKVSEDAAKDSEDAAKTHELAAKVSEDAAKASELASKDSEDAAKASELASKDSEDAAKVSELAAKDSEDAAKASEDAAKDSEDAAKASEDAAKVSENATKASEDAAKASELAAKDSEDAAKVSENAAKASEDAAKVSELTAKDSEDAAKASELASKVSELAAKDSEDAAKASEDAARASEDMAKASENAAKSSENMAKTSENASKDSELNARVSELAAKTSENNARASENAAKVSELASKTSENNAKASENAASDSKNAATESELAAKASENAAKTSENNAKAHENAAKASELASKASENNAKTSEDLARDAEVAARVSELAAKASELAAKDSEDAAKDSEDAAKDSENAAKDSEDAAKASENAAKVSENAAKASEQNAKASENAAKASEIAADLSEQSAALSESKAEASKNDAKLSELEAKSSKLDAKTSEQEARAAAINAQISEANAKNSELNAAESELSAQQLANSFKIIPSSVEDNIVQVDEDGRTIYVPAPPIYNITRLNSDDTAPVVSAENAVAIGAGSVANENDTVSVGSRRVVMVANPVGGTDAVNVDYLTDQLLLKADVTALQSVDAAKVDKESGMGLSSNDFTTQEKNKLATLESSKFKGEFASLQSLIGSVASPQAGDYANVNSPGSEVIRYVYDTDDGEWVQLSGVVAPLTAAQVKELYEINPDTNVLSDARLTKLNGIADEATKNATDAQLRDRSTHTGTQAIGTIVGLQDALNNKPSSALVTTTTSGLMSPVDKVKLDDIDVGATANSTDGFLVNRTNHTGTQAISTITGLQSALNDKAGLTLATEDSNGLMSSAHVRKLNLVDDQATKNESDEFLVDRANHTGTQAISTITGLQTTLNEKAGLSLATDVVAGLMPPTSVAKLNGIATEATKNATDAQLRNRSTHTGTQAIGTIVGLQDALDDKAGLSIVSTEVSGLMSSALFTKLNGIASEATKNATDAQLRNRSTHTGTQAIGTIVGLQDALDDKADIVDATDSVSGLMSPTQFRKLRDIESEATKNATDAQLRDRSTHTGTQAIGTIEGLTEALVGISEDTGMVTEDHHGLMSSVDKIKLNGIAVNATANSTDAQLRDRSTHTGTQAISTVTGLQTALNGKASTSVVTAESSGLMSSAMFTKLNGIAVNATANSTDAQLRDRSTHTGVQAISTIDGLSTELTDLNDRTAPVSATNDGVMTTALFTKLSGITTGATANSTDSQLRDRSTHTGTQAIDTIESLRAELDGRPTWDEVEQMIATKLNLTLQDAFGNNIGLILPTE